MTKFLAGCAMIGICLTPVAWADCPPASYPPTASAAEQMARTRLAESVLAQGAEAVLARHGFCPTDDGFSAFLLDQQCDGENCVSDYLVQRSFAHGATGEQRTVVAYLHLRSNAEEPIDNGSFDLRDPGLRGIARQVSVDGFAAEVLLSALDLAGAPRNPDVVRGVELVAGRLGCAQPLAQPARTSCEFQVLDQTLGFEDPDGNRLLHSTLKGVSGATVLNGVEWTFGALLACYRGVGAPEAPGAQCSLYVEETSRG